MSTAMTTATEAQHDHRQPHERSRVTSETFDDRVGTAQLPPLSDSEVHTPEHEHLDGYQFATDDPGYVRLLLDLVDLNSAAIAGADEARVDDTREQSLTKTGICVGYLLAVESDFSSDESDPDAERVHVAHVHRLQQEAQDRVVADLHALVSLTRMYGLRGLYESAGLGEEHQDYVDAVAVDHLRHEERHQQVRDLFGSGLSIPDLLRGSLIRVDRAEAAADVTDAAQPETGDSHGAEEPEPATVTGP